MSIFRIEVRPRDFRSDHALETTAHSLAAPQLTACYVTRLFFVEADLSESQVQTLAHSLLADPVTEDFTLGEMPVFPDAQRIERTPLPGVTDPTAESLIRAAALLKLPIVRAATGQRYDLLGAVDASALTWQMFANRTIHRAVVNQAISAPFVEVQLADATVETVAVRGLTDAALLALSTERRLSLDLNEMRAIQAYFDGILRDPTDAELEMLAQTWSEHCVHKTFKARIDYTATDALGATTTEQIDGLLKTYLRAATDQLAKPWVRSAFVDNAGVIAYTDDYDLAFKVETHNRPSALEPFGGANTGVGGVIRDVLGVSARPFANTDILCFGPPDTPFESLPDNILHPRRIIAGVVHGVEDYGNKMGIPTVNGAIHYHAGYTANPLVFAGCVGIVPRDSHRSVAEPGDLIVVLGGRTGRDGLRGATFSSMEMSTDSAALSGGAVQIGHPIHEKQVQEVVIRARDAGLYTAITDCGAGGLSSAVGEMGAKIGASVFLERVPLKYPGLRPWEIWLSEAQERMVLAVPAERWAALAALCEAHEVEAVAIGNFEPSGALSLSYNGAFVGAVSMEFLHDGIPQRHLTATWTAPSTALTHAPLIFPVFGQRAEGRASGFTSRTTTTLRPPREDCLRLLTALLAMPTIRSKEAVIRRYDHEVQGGTAVKPLVGLTMRGPSDAAVLIPREVQTTSAPGVVLSNGLCPQYTELDPYAMAFAAVDEAVRNAVAVGADPDTLAILDNFSWGNAQLPDRLGSLVRCSQGCHDAALTYGTPFVSGKDSLNNEYLDSDGVRRAIPGTLVISAIGLVPDADLAVTSDLKTPGNRLYLVGETRKELGGSHYHLLRAESGGDVPAPIHDPLTRYRALHAAIRAGWVQSAHDLSEGGLGVALAEMCIGGGRGADISIRELVAAFDGNDAELFFSESAGRMLVEIAPEDCASFEAGLLDAGVVFAPLGTVNDEGVLSVIGRDPGASFGVPVADLERAWRGDSDEPRLSLPTEDAPQHAYPLASARRRSEPPVLILHAPGTNRDHDAALAVQLAGGTPEIVTVRQLIEGDRDLLDYAMLVIPGGFSYGDDLGAGALWALDLRERLHGLERFVEDGRPVLGICNGFQTLVKSGLLPGSGWDGGSRRVTLTYNALGHFECRWVWLQPNPASPSLFTEGLTEPILCPIAHGEGRVAADDITRERLWADNLPALTYASPDGRPATYPLNPNGSLDAIAGLSNLAGNVFGLMPHPENHVFPWQNPQGVRGARGFDGLRLFQNAIKRC